MRRAVPFAALTCAVVTGCVSTQVTSLRDAVSIAEAVNFSLPEPEELGPQVRATQILTGQYEDEEFDFQLSLEWRQDAIVVAAFTHFGNTLFSMSYDGTDITTVGNGLVLRGLDTTYVMADILITFGDRQLIQRHLTGTGVEVHDSDDRRLITRDGSPIIRIEYQHPSRWTGRVHFSHVERGYSYDIETVQFAPI